MQDNSPERYNLDNFEAIFKEYLQNEDVSFITLKNYLSDFRHFFGWFSFFLQQKTNNEIKDVDQYTIGVNLTKNAIEQYKSYLKSNALPLKTINRRLSTLRKFCTLCVNQGWMKENPAKQVVNIALSLPQSIKTTKESENPVSSNVQSVFETQKNIPADILGEYKKYLLSQQSKTESPDLAIHDVRDFLSFINY